MISDIDSLTVGRMPYSECFVIIVGVVNGL